MKINLCSPNPALLSIFKDSTQIITLDANFLIPPNRRQAHNSFSFNKFKNIWLEPIFKSFPNLAIHECVYDELIKPSIKKYIDNYIKSKILIIHKDSSLTPQEEALRNIIEEKIYPYTNYDPNLNNKNDKGEVKSLAYIAVKGFLYFAAHDHNAIQLIEKSKQWSTGLDNIQAIKMYEIIYYLYRIDNCDKKALRMLYKYQYYLTKNEKNTNPEWIIFITTMDNLYNNI